VLEALQAGAAIVASDLDGLPEDLTAGRDALLTPPGEVFPLARAIRQLLEDRELAARMGAEARATYEQRFAAPVMARELRALYSELGLEPSG